MQDCFSETLIGPCGMNCAICYAFLREKNRCTGCRGFCAEEPVSIARCKIRNCDFIKTSKVDFCFECECYPCKNLKNLDKRYRARYNMSEIENLEHIRQFGLASFIERERIKWTCPSCEGIIYVHKQSCSKCGKMKINLSHDRL